MLRCGLSIFRRVLSTTVTDGEKRLTELLRNGIPGTTDVVVEDVSSRSLVYISNSLILDGCGSMYSVYVEASSFGGKSKVAQHKMVTELLKEQIKDMHGLSIKTKVSK